MTEGVPELSISIVSHGQAGLVGSLLQDLQGLCADGRFEVILTLNIPETLPFDPHGMGFTVTLIHNRDPQGFGHNHNAAFRHARGRYFCVMNPDIRLKGDPFPSLRSEFSDLSVGVAGPRIEDAYGNPEDSARDFPSPLELLGKLFGGSSSTHVAHGETASEPDWLAGMFLMFPREVYAKAGGFDERYFLYYEDVDICLRLRLAGYRVRLCRAASAIHEARRSSRRNPRYMYWHLSSMLRFFLSSSYRRMRQLSRP
jgi:GT2 family glycosyltransferase